MKTYDVVIIGAGIGGLAAGVLLAHEGKKVAILEKNAFPGGRLSSYEKDGFIVDFGVHTISRAEKGPIGTILDKCGFPDAVKYTTVRPITRYRGENFKFPRDLAKYVPEEDFNGLMAFIKEIYGMTPEQMDDLDKISLDDYLDRFTTNEIVHSVVTTIGQVYCAVPGWTESAGEFARCLSWEASSRSSGYPIGGCMAITNAYADAFDKLGGDLVLSAPAEKIIVEDEKAVGVIAGGEEYRAPIVISNADIKKTIFDLAGKEHFPAHYNMKIKNLKWANAGPSWKIALDSKLTDVQMLSQSPDLPCAEYYSQLEDGIMPEVPYVFFVVPSNFSEGVAPEGQQLLQVATPLPVDTPESILEQIPDILLKSLDDLVPGYREHVIWKDWFGIQPLDAMASEGGATIGAGQIVGQVGEARPNQKTPLKGLYLVGGEAGGHGVGIELAASSAIELVETIL